MMTWGRFISLRGLSVIPIAALFLLAACGGDKPVAGAGETETPIEVLYNTALDDLIAEAYLDAADGFDQVERQYPYSVWATKAQLMGMFSYYMVNDYDLAVETAERYIRLHPGSKETPYAHYMIALSYYERITDVERDQSNTRKALDKLEEVIRRYPRSSYAQDAQAKIALTQGHLAGKQMSIGRYYLERGHAVAAINRFRTVVNDYQTTVHAPEALHRLVESYLLLGVVDEAKAVAAVLGHNYPRSAWYRDSYALLQGGQLTPPDDSGDSWFSRIWRIF